MAKDDYHVILYQILSYLYQSLKLGQKIDPQMLMRDGKMFQINQRYYEFIMESILLEGYVSGIQIEETMSGKYVIGLEHMYITPKGIEYLMDNSFIKKAQRFAKELKEMTPFI